LVRSFADTACLLCRTCVSYFCNRLSSLTHFLSLSRMFVKWFPRNLASYPYVRGGVSMAPCPSCYATLAVGFQSSITLSSFFLSPSVGSCSVESMKPHSDGACRQVLQGLGRRWSALCFLVDCRAPLELSSIWYPTCIRQPVSMPAHHHHVYTASRLGCGGRKSAAS